MTTDQTHRDGAVQNGTFSKVLLVLLSALFSAFLLLVSAWVDAIADDQIKSKEAIQQHARDPSGHQGIAVNRQAIVSLHTKVDEVSIQSRANHDLIIDIDKKLAELLAIEKDRQRRGDG